MTPNDALTQLERTHKQPYSSSPVSPSLRRRLTRSPSPALSCISNDSKSSRRSSYSSDSDTTMRPRSKRKPLSKSFSNGYTNGISHVPEEASSDEAVVLSPSPARKSQKVNWEIPRKTLHASIGFLTLTLYSSSFSLTPVIQILSGTLLVVVTAEVLRFRSERFEAVYETGLGFLMRESEKSKINGVVWYLCGVLFVLSLYPLDVAVVSILILSWADTAASTFGRLYGVSTPKLPSGHIPIPMPFIPSARWPRIQFASQKSLAGFIASTSAGFLIATSFWGYFAWLREAPPFGDSTCFSRAPIGALSNWARLGGVGLISGLVSGVAEALDLGSVDDNLTLPIISGAAMWVVLRLLCY